MPLARFTTVGTFAATLAACATVTTADGDRLGVSSDAFRGYVERVFREQNRVASELAFAIEDAAEGPRSAELMTAEDRLIEACAGLNELATRRRDERRLGVRKRLEDARAAPACEVATRAALAALGTPRSG